MSTPSIASAAPVYMLNTVTRVSSIPLAHVFSRYSSPLPSRRPYTCGMSSVVNVPGKSACHRLTSSTCFPASSSTSATPAA